MLIVKNTIIIFTNYLNEDILTVIKNKISREYYTNFSNLKWIKKENKQCANEMNIYHESGITGIEYPNQNPKAGATLANCKKACAENPDCKAINFMKSYNNKSYCDSEGKKCVCFIKTKYQPCLNDDSQLLPSIGIDFYKKSKEGDCIGSWSDWSTCSADCGDGTQTRTY